jgi:hypothetical protein
MLILNRRARPDEKLEEFHLWTQPAQRRRLRIDWLSVAIWGALALIAFAFWGAVAWAIVAGVIW